MWWKIAFVSKLWTTQCYTTHSHNIFFHCVHVSDEFFRRESTKKKFWILNNFCTSFELKFLEIFNNYFENFKQCTWTKWLPYLIFFYLLTNNRHQNYADVMAVGRYVTVSQKNWRMVLFAYINMKYFKIHLEALHTL